MDMASAANHTATAYLGLGANLGDRAANINTALRLLDALPTIEVRTISSMYETAPVGVTDQPQFINAAAEIQTSLSPESLLETVLGIEKQMGRVRTIRWGPRVIDIDVLIYEGEERATAALTLPHPEINQRAFVLVPLAQIAPNLVIQPFPELLSARAKLIRNGEWNIFTKQNVKEF